MARRLNSRPIKFLDREVAVKASMEKHVITQMFQSGEIHVLLPNGRNGVVSNSVQRNVKAVLFPADASVYMEKLGMKVVAENTSRKKIKRAILKFVLTGIPGANGRSVTKKCGGGRRERTRNCSRIGCKGDKEQVETCNTRRCTVTGDQITENQYLTEIRDATQDRENECLTGRNDCTERQICKNKIDGFSCEDKEEIFENFSRFIVTSTVDFAPNENKEIGALTRDYNVKVVLDKLNPSSVNQPVFTVETADQKVIQLILTENSGSTSTEAPYIVQVICENQRIIEVPITNPDKFNEINIFQRCKDSLCVKDITLNGKLISQSSSPDAEIHGGATGETGNGVKEVGVNVGKEIDESVCEESPLVENLWLVDGTGSYQGYRNKAKEEFVKNWNYLKQKAPDTKLALAFFADRNHNFGEALNKIYQVGISMKSVNDISIAEINSGFQKINQMGGGGDGLEDQLLGMIFSMDKDRVEWGLNSRIRLFNFH